MAARSAKLHACLLILSLWAPSAINPASAQVPLPADLISPDVPHDVANGPGASIQDLAIFAWREFIALNWVALDPATTNMRGRPNVNADFLGIKADGNGNFPLLVWHTYQHKNELFPASGQTAASFDSKAPAYNYQDPQPVQGKSYPLQPGQPVTNATASLFNNLDEASEIGLAIMYAHYASATNNIRVAYEAKVNRAVFDYLNNNKFTQCPGLYCQTLSNARTKTSDNLGEYGGICSTDTTIVSLPCGDTTVTGDAGEGAIEIKAAWRKLTDQEVARGHFFTQTVIYYTGNDPQLYNNAVYGLLPCISSIRRNRFRHLCSRPGSRSTTMMTRPGRTRRT